MPFSTSKGFHVNGVLRVLARGYGRSNSIWSDVTTDSKQGLYDNSKDGFSVFVDIFANVFDIYFITTLPPQRL